MTLNSTWFYIINKTNQNKMFKKKKTDVTQKTAFKFPCF